MKSSSRKGLSILAGGLAFVGSASAVDLIVNGSFEANGDINSPGTTPTGWTGFVQTYNYSANYYSGPAIPAGEMPGTYYSWQHRTAVGVNDAAGVTGVTQTVNLTDAITTGEIDGGMGQFTFSSWLASYGIPNANPEQPYLTLQFFDAGSAQVGSTVVFDRTSSAFFTIHASGSTTFDGPTSHSWAKYVRTSTVPATARTAKVGIGRSPNAALSGSPDTYVDLVKLDVVVGAVAIPPFLSAATPGNNASNVSPGVVIKVILEDQTTQVDTDEIQFMFDASTVMPSIQKVGGQTTIQYDPPGLLAPLSTHSYKIVFSDNGVPVTTKTNEFQFGVADWVNLVLPAPKYLENFNSVSEGTLPASWTVQNSTTLETEGNNAQDITSDFYVDWAVVTSTTTTFLSTNYGDYSTLLSVSPGAVVNGAALSNLIDGTSLLAASAGRLGAGIQVNYLFSGDYDLTGDTNVYLVFNSIWVQNQDSGAAVEYSIDGGATWLPGMYLLDQSDMVSVPRGGIDASNTFGTVHGDVANLNTLLPEDGFYGAFIGVGQSQWSTLGPYLSPRVNDDDVGSKRVEVIRLAQADGQSAVRLRFAHHGSDSWYHAIDNVGFYCLNSVPVPLLGTVTPASQVVSIGNNATLAVNASGPIPLTYQWRKNGVNISGATGPGLLLSNVQTNDAGSYTVVVTSPGGSVTSAPPATLTVVNPLGFVTGQWDFKNGDLTATCGQDLQYRGDTAATTTFPMLMIGGQSTAVMNFPACSASQGYILSHGTAPNGGGAYVNQYTLIMDIMFPAASSGNWRALLQSNPGNPLNTDAEFYLNPANGIGINGQYDGVIQPDTWHRVALAVDLTASGGDRLAKFIDGVKVGTQDIGDLDGRFALDPTALLFTDGYVPAEFTQSGFVSSIQFSDGRRSDGYIAALGGATASKIPGCIRIYTQGGNIFIERTGNWGLECANEVTGTWSEIIGAANPYPVPVPLGNRRFYRPKQP